MTNDFAQLFVHSASALRIPIKQTLKRLKHLGLHVYAQANQQAYVGYLLMIIELSTSLTSLSISSQNYLSIENLKLGSLVCLQSLCLQRVKISSPCLVNLLEQCNWSMANIQLQHVEIERESWGDVIYALENLMQLRDFNVSVSGRLTGRENFWLDSEIVFRSGKCERIWVVCT